MTITEHMVDRVARLAMLEVPEGEKAALAAELGRIVDYMGQLDRLEAAGGETVDPRADVLRPDGVCPSAGREALLACAPAAEGGLVTVPRTVE